MIGSWAGLGLWEGGLGDGAWGRGPVVVCLRGSFSVLCAAVGDRLAKTVKRRSS
jgi:hypothetical protein